MTKIRRYKKEDERKKKNKKVENKGYTRPFTSNFADSDCHLTN